MVGSKICTYSLVLETIRISTSFLNHNAWGIIFYRKKKTTSMCIITFCVLEAILLLSTEDMIYCHSQHFLEAMFSKPPYIYVCCFFFPSFFFILKIFCFNCNLLTCCAKIKHKIIDLIYFKENVKTTCHVLYPAQW